MIYHNSSNVTNCILHCFYATINALAIFATTGLGFSLSSGLVPSMSLNEACTKWPHIFVHIFTHSPKVSGHDEIIKLKHFPRYWPFVRGIHRSPVNSPHKGQWRGALMDSLSSVWINGWINKRKAGDLRRHRAHYDVIVRGYRFRTSGWAVVRKARRNHLVSALTSAIFLGSFSDD